MKVKLDYGRDGLEIAVPDSAEVLQMAPSEGLDRIEERIDHALSRPIGTPWPCGGWREGAKTPA